MQEMPFIVDTAGLFTAVAWRKCRPFADLSDNWLIEPLIIMFDKSEASCQVAGVIAEGVHNPPPGGLGRCTMITFLSSRFASPAAGGIHGGASDSSLNTIYPAFRNHKINRASFAGSLDFGVQLRQAGIVGKASCNQTVMPSQQVAKML